MTVPAYTSTVRIELDGQIYGRVVISSSIEPRPQSTASCAVGDTHWYADIDVILEDRLCPTCYALHTAWRPLGHDGICGSTA